MGMRKNIYMNPPLEALAEKVSELEKGRDGNFSRRLGDIVERYTVLMSLVPAPKMSDEEMVLLASVIYGSPVNTTQIRLLNEYILDSGTSSLEIREGFAKKVAKWSICERLMAVESVYI